MCELMGPGNRVGLRVYLGGNVWRIYCHFVDDCTLKSVTLVTWLVCEDWKVELIETAVTVLSCLDPRPVVCAIVVDTHLALGHALAHLDDFRQSVVMRFFDVQWLQRCIRQYREHVGGLDPYNILDFLKYRLSGVIKDLNFDKMPLLRQVVKFFLCSLGSFYQKGKQEGKEFFSKKGVREVKEYGLCFLCI